MNEMLKKYLKVSLTLGLIAGCSSLLIGMTNFVTKDRIIENAKKREEDGLKKVFASITKEEEVKFEEKTIEKEFAYIQNIWTTTLASGSEVGTIYKTSGKNAYGSVTLLIGFEKGKSTLYQMITLENTETYGAKLQDNYIDEVNTGDREFSSVSCGATYGAKLCRAMVEECIEDLGITTGGSEEDAGASA